MSNASRPAPSASKAALRAACKVRGIKMRSKLSRDEMRAAIEAWETARGDKEIEAAQNWYFR